MEKTPNEGISFSYQFKVPDYEETMQDGDFINEIEIQIYAFAPDTPSGELLVGEAIVHLFDIHHIREGNWDPFECLEAYNQSLCDLGWFIFKQNGEFTSRYISRMHVLSHGYIDKWTIDSIDRIAVIERRTTVPEFRGHNLTRRFYKSLANTLRCDLLITRPFPLQYENQEQDRIPDNDEFGLTFEQAYNKLRKHYRRAGMRKLFGDWLCMLNI